MPHFLNEVGIRCIRQMWPLACIYYLPAVVEIVGGIEVWMYYIVMGNLYYVPSFSDDFALGFCPPSQSKCRVGRSLEDKGVGEVVDFVEWVNGGITNAPQLVMGSFTG